MGEETHREQLCIKTINKRTNAHSFPQLHKTLNKQTRNVTTAELTRHKLGEHLRAGGGNW